MKHDEFVNVNPSPILDFYTSFISLENELAAWNYLDGLASNYLGKFATTLQQDMQIL